MVLQDYNGLKSNKTEDRTSMKIVGINSHPSGSTKNIMVSILNEAEDELGADTYAFWGMWKSKKTVDKKRSSFGYQAENVLNAIVSRNTGIHCQGSILGTWMLIQKLKRIEPDLVHIHNLHLWTINVPIIMNYIKRNNIPVVWTLHDCWAFTGHCAHFLQTGCEKWRDGCYRCESLHRYPFSKLDKTDVMWKKKRDWFSNVEKLQIVTPSEWLKNLVGQSFLQNYPVKVINNGIDLEIFKPIASDFRERHSLTGKFLVLGVAFQWSHAKGLDVFINLAKDLDPELYRIVLVGTDDTIDRELPNIIISIHRTESQRKLAEIYTAADVFLNPTREENFPTTNLESLACGTPVITSSVGGCPETISNECGLVVNPEEFVHLNKIIEKCKEEKSFSKEKCIRFASRFRAVDKYKEYARLYLSIIGDKV